MFPFDTKFQVPLTNKCPLRCVFCKNDSTEQSSISTIPIHKVKEYIDFAEKWKAETIELGVLIGEPLLYNPKDLKEIIEYCYTKSFSKILIFSSLVVLPLEILDIFNSKIELTLSFYGNSPEDYKERTSLNLFDTVLNNLKIIASKPRTFTLVISNRTNEDSLNLDSIMDDLKANINLVFIHAYDFEKPGTKQETKLPKRNKVCKYVYQDIGINYQGDLLLCAWLDTLGETKLGNIETNTFQELKRNFDKMVKFQNKGAFSSFCSKCAGYQPYNTKENFK